MKIAIYYGSTSGSTERVAEMIRQYLGGKAYVDLFDVATLQNAHSMNQYDVLIWGSSTWDDGQLQYDWEDFAQRLDDTQLTGKTVAIFGLGDQLGYDQEFVDAIKILHDKAEAMGARIVGYWPDQGYDYKASRAAVKGVFLGLAIDEDNQSELTEERVAQWTRQLREELAI